MLRYFLDARAGDEVWSFGGHHYLGTIAAIRTRVLAGAGLAVLPHDCVESDLARGRLVELMPRTRIPSDWFRRCSRTAHTHAPELRMLGAELSHLPLR